MDDDDQSDDSRRKSAAKKRSRTPSTAKSTQASSSKKRGRRSRLDDSDDEVDAKSDSAEDDFAGISDEDNVPVSTKRGKYIKEDSYDEDEEIIFQKATPRGGRVSYLTQLFLPSN